RTQHYLPLVAMPCNYIANSQLLSHDRPKELIHLSAGSHWVYTVPFLKAAVQLPLLQCFGVHHLVPFLFPSIHLTTPFSQVPH
uniref:Uncharacterized protein n=1 Tax=Oreochromis aureus TaxID=47969 RepID=A0AAZ1XY91_OREAU